MTDYDEKKVSLHSKKVQHFDEESEGEEYLCNNDMGIINKFVQNSHNYQKEISYLINSSQLEDTYRKSKKKKLKTCKTEGNNILFTHNLINDIMRRINNGHTNGKIIFSPQT